MNRGGQNTGTGYVYYHIPKCGGTTVAALARLNFGKGRLLSIYEKNPTMNLVKIDQIASFDRYRLIKTHVPYGAVPGLADLPAFTILRNPRDRLVSLMRDIRDRDSHYLHESLGGAKFSVDRFLEQAPFWEVDNILVRYLIGRKGFTQEAIGESELDEAIDSLLHRLTWFGLQEQFDKTIQLLSRRLDMTFVADLKLNESRKTDSIQGSVEASVSECVRLDEKLYAIAVDHFNQRAVDSGVRPILRNKIALSFLRFASRVL